MIALYLNKDIKGASSRILYGKKGDKIYIIDRRNEMILVVNDAGSKFYIKESDYLNYKEK